MGLKIRHLPPTSGDPANAPVPPGELRKAEMVAARIDAGLEPSIPASVVRRVFVEGTPPLKAYREWRGMTMEELAQQSGLSLQLLQGVEDGRLTLSRNQAAQLASILQLHPDLLTD